MDADTRQLLEALQRSCATAATRLGQLIPLPPLVVLFNVIDSSEYCNYGIPMADGRDEKTPVGFADKLRRLFARIERKPRIEICAELFSHTVRRLEGAGFHRAMEIPIMVCSSPVKADESISVDWVSADDRAALIGVIQARNAAFAGADPEMPAGEDAVGELSEHLRSGAYRQAAIRQDGRIVAVGALLNGGLVREIAGVATLPAYRGRGFARAISAFAVRQHLRAGGTAVWLSAGDATAERVYERVGFRRVGTQLHLVDVVDAVGCGRDAIASDTAMRTQHS